MARGRDHDRIEPRTITVIVDGEAITGIVHIERSGPNRYQYSVSYAGEWRTNTEALMPSTWHCEEYGKRDLFNMALAKRKKESGS